MKARHFLAMAFLLSFLTSVTAHAWVTEKPDTEGYTGLRTSLALDSSYIPHISYLDWTSQNLKYATKIRNEQSGNWEWHAIPVDFTGDAVDGTCTSIALDSENNVHISYADWTEDKKDLKHVTNTDPPGGWVVTTVDEDDDVGLFSSIAVDSQGYVHISYYDATNDDLKYATNCSGWKVELVDGIGQVGMFSSIAVDDSDPQNVYISYWGDEGLEMASKAISSDTWIFEVVDESDPAVGKYTSIAVDDSDPQNIHISYIDDTRDYLMYATSPIPSGDWVIEEVDQGGVAGWDTSIALDSSGNPHISYYDFAGDNLKYATNASGDWVPETVDDGESVGMHSSIALDSEGNVYISYFSVNSVETINPYPTSETDDLKYANNACIDNDSDGYGDPGHKACVVGSETDCDDEKDWVNPGKDEACDGEDTDCDPETEFEEPEDDQDEDGHMVCAGDCADDPTNDPPICGEPEPCTCGETECAPCAGCIHPQVKEEGYGDPICSDGLDNNCEDGADSEDPGCCECIDLDRDGFGEHAVGAPPGVGCVNCPDRRRDCDDNDPYVNPDAIEECGKNTCRDGKDNDCDGLIDDEDYDCTEWCISLAGASTIGKADHVNYLFLLAPFALILVLKRRRGRD